jgi:hypothetical protein
LLPTALVVETKTYCRDELFPLIGTTIVKRGISCFSKKELEIIRGHATPEMKKSVERARVRAAQHPIPPPLLGM